MDADTLVLDRATRADVDRRLESFARAVVAPPVAMSHVRRQGGACAEIVMEDRAEW